MQQIEKEEWMHVKHGETWVKRLAADPATKAEIQAALDFWFPKVNKVFGKAHTETNQTFQKFKLKQRDNHEVREAWYQEMVEPLASYGLKLPAITVVEN
jgi:ring-1,2-phenylacetyl-CoA epoxidase subunit PaaA